MTFLTKKNHNLILGSLHGQQENQDIFPSSYATLIGINSITIKYINKHI